MFKASLSGDGDVVDFSEVLEGLKISKKQFQEMCIAAGCDYLKNIRGVGIARAFQLAATGGDILEALVQRGADETYQANFHKAMAVFHHQTVFDVKSCSTVPLEKWDTDHPWMFSTCVDSILIQNNLNHANLEFQFFDTLHFTLVRLEGQI